MFPTQPCKQARRAGGTGSWGARAEPRHRAAPHRAGTDDGIARLSLWGQPGHQHCPGGQRCPGTVPEPSGRTFPPRLTILGQEQGRQRQCWQPATLSKRYQGPATPPAPHPQGYRSLQPTPASRTTTHRPSARSSAAALQPRPRTALPATPAIPSGFLLCCPPLQTKRVPHMDVYDRAARCLFFVWFFPFFLI